VNWHRLRGHRIREERRRWYLGPPDSEIEQGGEYFVRVCSCGETWRRVIDNPLRGKWVWI